MRLVEANGIRLRGNIEGNNQARRIIEEAMAMCPENPLGYTHLGWVYHHDYLLGNTKSPQETLEKAIELGQKALAMEAISGAHVLLCHCYYKKGEYAKAIAEGERAVELTPGGISALNGYAVSLSMAYRTEEAIPIFEKAIRLSPFSDAYLYRDFGFALRNAGRFAEAVSNFKKAIQIAPDDMIAHNSLMGAYIMMGHWKEARAEAAVILRIDPKYAAGFFPKDSPDKEQSQTEKVDSVLRGAGVSALNGYGRNLTYTGRPQEAIPIFQRAIKLSPSGPAYLYGNLGVALRNAGRFGEAVIVFRKAFQIKPDSIDPLIEMTITYSMMGREKEAREEAAEVLRLNPAFSVDSWAKNLTYRDPFQNEKLVGALRKAGLK